MINSIYLLTGAWGTHSFSYGCLGHPQKLYSKPYQTILKYAILKFLRVLGAPVGLVISDIISLEEWKWCIM